jgi:hypothetical protein
MDHHADDSEHYQDVDQSGRYVENAESTDPGQEQYDSEDEKHGCLLSVSDPYVSRDVDGTTVAGSAPQ